MKRITLLFLTLAFSTLANAYVVGPTHPDNKPGGSPGKWGDATMGTGAIVTWSIMGDSTPNDCGHYDSDCVANSITPLTTLFQSISNWKAELERAFAAWSSVADLTFIELTDQGETIGEYIDSGAKTTSSDIRIGAHDFSSNSTLAHGYYPPWNGGAIAGDIHFNSNQTWGIGYAGSAYDIFQVFTHELGHALGLDHTGVSNSLLNPYYSESFTGPQADDIAGMQYLYGAAEVTETPLPATFLLMIIGLFGLYRIKNTSQIN